MPLAESSDPRLVADDHCYSHSRRRVPSKCWASSGRASSILLSIKIELELSATDRAMSSPRRTAAAAVPGRLVSPRGRRRAKISIYETKMSSLMLGTEDELYTYLKQAALDGAAGVTATRSEGLFAYRPDF